MQAETTILPPAPKEPLESVDSEINSMRRDSVASHTQPMSPTLTGMNQGPEIFIVQQRSPKKGKGKMRITPTKAGVSVAIDDQRRQQNHSTQHHYQQRSIQFEKGGKPLDYVKIFSEGLNN